MRWARALGIFFTSILNVVVEITETFVLPSLFRSLCRIQLVSHTLEPRHMNAIVTRQPQEKKERVEKTTFVTIAVAPFVGRSYFMHMPCTLCTDRASEMAMFSVCLLNRRRLPMCSVEAKATRTQCKWERIRISRMCLLGIKLRFHQIARPEWNGCRSLSVLLFPTKIAYIFIYSWAFFFIYLFN